VVELREFAPWLVAPDLSISFTGALSASFEPQWKLHHEGKCQPQMCQLQGARLDRQPPPQFACALKKPPLNRTSESAIPKISFLLIIFS
jgi:hypothetical protein